MRWRVFGGRMVAGVGEQDPAEHQGQAAPAMPDNLLSCTLNPQLFISGPGLATLAGPGVLILDCTVMGTASR